MFRLVAGELCTRVRRIPDGETGPRADWIVWQYPVLSSRPQFEAPPDAAVVPRAAAAPAPPGQDASSSSSTRSGTPTPPSASYRTFAVKRDGIVPRGCRFQVAPTPLAPVSAFVAVEDQAAVEPAYERAMRRESRIAAEIPTTSSRSSGTRTSSSACSRATCRRRSATSAPACSSGCSGLAVLVPADVELGFHFCAGHDEQEPRHVPADAGAMVDLANALAAGLERGLDWLHLPIPSAPDDAAFVEPLRRSGLQPGTEVYLGLLHPGEVDEGRGGGSPSPGRRSMRSASRRRAAGEARPGVVRSSSSGTSASAVRSRTSRRR